MGLFYNLSHNKKFRGRAGPELIYSSGKRYLPSFYTVRW